jgi:iron transport multicopper oxidase
MFTALTMGEDALNDRVYGHQTNAFAYPHMSNIELTVFNWDAGFHPFHLHGYAALPLAHIPTLHESTDEADTQ